jgi:PTS system mannose-specific IIA component
MMIGVLITTHGSLGNELIKAAELIKGKLEGVSYVSVDQKKAMEEIKKEISSSIKKLDRGQGVLYLQIFSVVHRPIFRCLFLRKESWRS